MSEIVTFPAMATLIGLAVALELAAVAEEECGGEQVLIEWILSRDDHDPALTAFAGLVEGCACDMLAALTLGRAA